MLKYGDKVLIYEDPITKEKPEEEAELLIYLDETEGMEFWKVRFADGSECGRWVSVEEKTK